MSSRAQRSYLKRLLRYARNDNDAYLLTLSTSRFASTVPKRTTGRGKAREKASPIPEDAPVTSAVPIVPIVPMPLLAEVLPKLSGVEEQFDMAALQTGQGPADGVGAVADALRLRFEEEVSLGTACSPRLQGPPQRGHR